MAGRPVQKKANIEALKKVKTMILPEIDNKPTIAYIMRNSGCTYAEIGEVLDISRQLAEYMVKSIDNAN